MAPLQALGRVCWTVAEQLTREDWFSLESSGSGGSRSPAVRMLVLLRSGHELEGPRDCRSCSSMCLPMARHSIPNGRSDTLFSAGRESHAVATDRGSCSSSGAIVWSASSRTIAQRTKAVCRRAQARTGLFWLADTRSLEGAVKCPAIHRVRDRRSRVSWRLRWRLQAVFRAGVAGGMTERPGCQRPAALVASVDLEWRLAVSLERWAAAAGGSGSAVGPDRLSTRLAFSRSCSWGS
jgi:hypothetical protein